MLMCSPYCREQSEHSGEWPYTGEALYYTTDMGNLLCVSDVITLNNRGTFLKITSCIIKSDSFAWWQEGQWLLLFQFVISQSPHIFFWLSVSQLLSDYVLTSVTGQKPHTQSKLFQYNTTCIINDWFTNGITPPRASQKKILDMMGSDNVNNPNKDGP